MDEKQSTAEPADAPRRRRVPPPTIELEATQVSAPDASAPAGDAAASASPESTGETSSAESSDATSSAESVTASTPPPGATAEPPPPGSNGGRGHFWPSFAAGLLGAVIALVAAAAAWELLGPGAGGAGIDRGAADTNARLIRIETQLDTLAHRNAAPAPADAKTPSDLTARLGSIESKLADQTAAVDRAVKPLDARLSDLTHRNDEIMAATQVARQRADAAAKSLADVAQQLTQLNAERAQAPQVQRADLDALSTRLASVESTTKAISQQLSHMANTAAGDTRQAVLAIALNTAVERGAPYARELAALDPSAAGAATLDALRPFADTGVPSAAALAHDLARLLPAARAAAGNPAPTGGFLQRLQSNAERLMRVRPIGPEPGDDPAAVLSRLDAKANQGDIAGALAEAGKLSATVRAPLDPWIKRAEAREAALKAASTLATRSLDGMRRAGQGAQQGTQGTAPQ